MSNYVKLTDYAAKDALTTGNPLKLIKGTEINDDLNAIQTAVATKADLSSPDFLGNPTAPTQTTGNSTTRLANTAFVQQELAAAQAAVDITGGTIDGVAITGGTVTGLATDLAVADGGTGASTLAANAVLLGNGTSALQTVAPSTSGNILKSNGTTWQSVASDPAIGVGQTWQDFTGSRSSGTTYTNSTSIPIMVVISNYRVASSGTSTVTVGGVIISKTRNQGTNDVGVASAITFIVPVGQTYIISNANIEHWAELR